MANHWRPKQLILYGLAIASVGVILYSQLERIVVLPTLFISAAVAGSFALSFLGMVVVLVGYVTWARRAAHESSTFSNNFLARTSLGSYLGFWTEGFP